MAQLSWSEYDTLAASTELDYFRKSMLLASHADAVASIEAMIAEGITEPQEKAYYTKKVAEMKQQPAVISGRATITSSTPEKNRAVA
jgi:hypothetical protein